VSDFQISEARIRELAEQESLTDEQVEDIVGAMAGRGLVYDDPGGILSETRRGPNPYDAAETWDEETLQLNLQDTMRGGETIVLLARGFQLSTATYSKSFDVSAKEDRLTGLTWNGDGTKFYIVGYGDAVHEYEVSTAWDVGTASFSQSLDISAQSDWGSDLIWNDTGSKLYVFDFDSSSVYSYACSVEYDISTASHVNTLSTSSNAASPRGGAWNDDGTTFYVADFDTRAVESYSCSTPYDLSTATHSQDYAVEAETGGFEGMAFNDDGTAMYTLVSDSSETNIIEHSLSTAYDISTASYSQTVSFTEDGEGTGVAWSKTGSKLYTVGDSNDNVYQYDVDTTKATSGTSYLRWDEPAAISEWDVVTFVVDEDGATIDAYVEYDDGGGWTAIGPISRNYSMSEEIAPSDDVRLRFDLSRPDDSYNPTVNAAYLSWFV